ncbi:uncharacterized protein LOC131229057 isoform X2 [Magnolia sinica]|uniref:uncharacterized protein LOC131229057 isoform X2 n=1 Tax=Magnolia sinica TaxID=86752 RepID=UPI00265B27BA|nr:uncharacterized protein LOC131229057 isoform X2 [Magnolia sinica]
MKPSISPGMDPTTSPWILEFLLCQPHLDAWVAHRLTSILPVSNDYPRLHKTILLRSIVSDISHRSISEATLESLELIEDLDHSAGLSIPDSMQAAYAAVAAECTAKFLKCEPEDHNEFVEAVNRIWKCRVSDMERSNLRVGLISKRLMELKKEMMTAVWNSGVRGELRARETMKEALDSVRVYLEEAVEEMGPSFLEYAAVEVCGQETDVRDSVTGLDGVSAGLGADDVVVIDDGAGSVEFDHVEEEDEEVRVCSSWRGGHMGSLPPAQKDVSDQDTVSTMEGTLAKLKEVGAAGMDNKFDRLPLVEVVKVKEALKSSSTNLRTVVEDPLPDALEMAAGILANMATEISHKAQEECENRVDVEALEEHQNGVDVGTNNLSVEKGVNANNAGATATGNQNGKHHDGTSFPSLMAWNRTAHTYEWDDDSISSQSEKSPNCSRGLHLPSPKNRVISPLKKREITRYSKRRKIKKWSSLEEETLRKAVENHGKGNWKFILNRHHQIFEDRTERLNYAD